MKNYALGVAMGIAGIAILALVWVGVGVAARLVWALVKFGWTWTEVLLGLQ